LADIDRQKLRSVSDLIRKGGKLLGEPCPKCGGVLVQYHGKTLCASCDDLDLIEKIKLAAPTDVTARLKRLASSKIEESANLLEGETDLEKQARLAELLLKYIEILENTRRYEAGSGSKRQEQSHGEEPTPSSG
jgi:uncharacterized Zn finger protein (UPF0148 family)